MVRARAAVAEVELEQEHAAARPTSARRLPSSSGEHAAARPTSARRSPSSSSTRSTAASTTAAAIARSWSRRSRRSAAAAIARSSRGRRSPSSSSTRSTAASTTAAAIGGEVVQSAASSRSAARWRDRARCSHAKLSSAGGTRPSAALQQTLVYGTLLGPSVRTPKHPLWMAHNPIPESTRRNTPMSVASGTLGTC
jgi:hypothetical protein